MIVVDAALAAKWVLPEEWSALALQLYWDQIRRREVVLAPSLLMYEVTNVIWQRQRRGALSAEDAGRVQDRLSAFPLALLQPPSLHQRALQLAQTHHLPATYDAHYVALAELAGCSCWTADRRRLCELKGHLPFVRAIEDYHPEEVG